MDCYCGNEVSSEEENREILTCLICQIKVHKTCYDLGEVAHPTFYCETCTLTLEEPLILITETLTEKDLIDDSGNGFVNFSVKLNSNQLSKLNTGTEFLNIFYSMKGKLYPPDESITVIIGSKSQLIKNNQYNLICWSKLHLSKHTSNLGLSYGPNPGDYSKTIYVCLCKKLNPQNVFTNVSDRRSSLMNEDTIETPFSMTLKKSVGKPPIPIPLICPFTTLVMRCPGKGIMCTHVNFFCIRTFIEFNLLNEKRDSRWKCPICMNRVYYLELYLDEEFMEVVKKYGAEIKGIEGDLTDMSEESSGNSHHKDNSKYMEEDKVENSSKTKVYVYNGEVYSFEKIKELLPWIFKKVSIRKLDKAPKVDQKAIRRQETASKIKENEIDLIELSKTENNSASRDDFLKSSVEGSRAASNKAKTQSSGIIEEIPQSQLDKNKGTPASNLAPKPGSPLTKQQTQIIEEEATPEKAPIDEPNTSFQDLLKSNSSPQQFNQSMKAFLQNYSREDLNLIRSNQNIESKALSVFHHCTSELTKSPNTRELFMMGCAVSQSEEEAGKVFGSLARMAGFDSSWTKLLFRISQEAAILTNRGGVQSFFNNTCSPIQAFIKVANFIYGYAAGWLQNSSNDKEQIDNNEEASQFITVVIDTLGVMVPLYFEPYRKSHIANSKEFSEIQKLVDSLESATFSLLAIRIAESIQVPELTDHLCYRLESASSKHLADP